MEEKYTKEFYAEYASRIIRFKKEGAIDFLKNVFDSTDLEKELRDEFGMRFFINQILLKSLEKVLSELERCDEFDVEFIARMRTEFLIGFLVDFLTDVGFEILNFCEGK